nr:hypothetical protein [Cupriavidus gilardii]
MIAAAHEAWICGNESGRVLGIVFGCAAAYGVYMVVRSWRRVG